MRSRHGDRLAQIERYAKQPAIVGVLPQTHRMLPVADVLALVEIARAAGQVCSSPYGMIPPRDFYKLREALGALDAD